ncbi:hypothetical protein OAL10_03910 [Gammaproteobacteria bacterium]|nr:hypothetical protein [Gammaproteobacteria bacterium]
MKTIICLMMILVSSQVMAESVHFKCKGTFVSSRGTTGEFENTHAVDMTNKTWETEEHIFDDVLVSTNQISVKGSTFEFTRKDYTMQISRMDLSYTKNIRFSVEGVPPSFMDSKGQCEIVEAPKVERAF